MRLNKRLLAATSVVVAVLVGAVAPAQAAGSTSEKSGQYCVVVLGKASNPATISPELYRHCSPHSFDTRAHLQDIEVQNELAGILAATNAVTGGEVATSAVASTHLFRAWSAADTKASTGTTTDPNHVTNTVTTGIHRVGGARISAQSSGAIKATAIGYVYTRLTAVPGQNLTCRSVI